MKYQEQVDMMLAHMARNYSTSEMLSLIKALGQGIAKASALVTSTDMQNTLLHNTHRAIVADAQQIADRYFMHRHAYGVNEQTVSVFMDSLRSPRRVEHG